MNRRTPASKAAAKITTVALVFVISICVASTTAAFLTTPLSQSALAQEFIDREDDLRPEPKAPMAVSQDGNNVYIVWWTNRSGNWEVMFRASNDGGQIFGDKINLSNTPDAESQTAEILAVENKVFVSWWELNENVHPHTNESVLRVSNDGGQTFGPVINLGTNGTINTTATSGDDGNTTTTADTAASTATG